MTLRPAPESRGYTAAIVRAQIGASRCRHCCRPTWFRRPRQAGSSADTMNAVGSPLPYRERPTTPARSSPQQDLDQGRGTGKSPASRSRAIGGASPGGMKRPLSRERTVRRYGLHELSRCPEYYGPARPFIHPRIWWYVATCRRPCSHRALAAEPRPMPLPRDAPAGAHFFKPRVPAGLSLQ
jgi:hypothetical protein